VSTDLLSPPLDPPLLDRALELHPQVALRPEPFGALAYHYGNRRLVFLQHEDMVSLARVLADHETLADALEACAIDRRRWPSFTKAVESLMKSEIIRER
jgi:putative mycofactocin binding protein MftB